MTDRSATATIKGYHYQFDKTILEILNLDEEGYVTVEGLEDVDVCTFVGTTAIQCKYYAAQKYSPSLVRKAVIAMLDDFLVRDSMAGPNVDYFLYGHFKEVSKMPGAIDLNYLQNMFRWKTKEPGAERDYQKEKGISDSQLQRFLTHFQMQIGPSFEEQCETVMLAIEKAYSCCRAEAELHFYSNALSKVLKLASIPDAPKRVVSKSQFITATNQARTLFNVWFLKWRGKEAYLKDLKKRLKDCNTLYGLNDKWLFLDAASVPLNSPEFSLVSLIEKLVEKYYRLGFTHYKNKPWTVVTTQSAKDMLVVKQHLIRGGIRFFDGMESIEFSTAFFSESPVFSTKGKNGKIDRASHQIRILSAETLETHRDILEPAPDVVLFVSRDLDPAELFGVHQGMQIHHLTYVDQLTDLATLI